MSAQSSPDHELMQILRFSAGDMETNRQGRLSLTQRARLLQEMDHLFLLFVILLPVWLIAWAIGRAPLVQVLIVAAMIVITGLLNRTSVKAFLDIVTGQVEHVSGTIAIEIYNYDQRTFAGMMQQQFANGTIGDIRFHLPAAMANNFHKVPLHIYYTPRYRKAVSGERIK